MSSYKTDQHRLVYRGRTFHFVSYEAHQANPRTGEAAMPATWFLMCAGKRWPVIAQIPDQDPDLVVAALIRWLDHHVFGAPAARS
jgi:hypothetical protein